MFVYVINRHGLPLMPCRPARARKLLRDEKAKVIKRTPFTIKLLYGASGYKQKVVAGMDTGSCKVGCAAITNGAVVYQAEIELRQDISRRLEQRAACRRQRRGRKTRYQVSRGDYRQTCGKRSEKKIPTGKLFGLRKYDLIKTPQGIGFIQGKRSSGQFALMDIFRAVISAAVNVNKDCARMAARTPTLLDRRRAFLPAVNGAVSCAQFE